jgi:hypothetical protein
MTTKMEMDPTERIRESIESKLGEILQDADRLKAAIAALGEDSPGKRRNPPRRRSSGEPHKRGSALQRSRRQSRTRGKAKPNTTPPHSRRAPIKNAVMAALTDANGEPMTASAIAASKGLGRNTVGTTLDRLCKNGEVSKAQRGRGFYIPTARKRS